jgi:hypothetical protein
LSEAETFLRKNLSVDVLRPASLILLLQLSNRVVETKRRPMLSEAETFLRKILSVDVLRPASLILLLQLSNRVVETDRR